MGARGRLLPVVSSCSPVRRRLPWQPTTHLAVSWLPRLVDCDGSLAGEGAVVTLSGSFSSWSGEIGQLPAGSSGSSSGL